MSAVNEADESPLSDEAQRLFRALDHAGDLPPAEARSAGMPASERLLDGQAGREAYGTVVRFMLRMRNDRLTAVRYRAYGCPHTLAACEWLARRLEGTVWPAAAQDAATALAALGSAADWAQALGAPPAKLGRLFVVEDALRAALLQNGAAANDLLPR